MSKKSVDKKAVVARINDLRIEGKTDQEIYGILAPEYYDRKTIAKIITATVTHERKEKYRFAQYALLVLIGITIAFKVLMAFGFAISMQSKAALIAVLIFPLLNVYFFVQIYRYHAESYRLCGILGLAGLGRLTNSRADIPAWAIAVDVAVAVAIIGLSFYLDAKLFPNFRPNSMKPDANGDYSVDSTQ